MFIFTVALLFNINISNHSCSLHVFHIHDIAGADTTNPVVANCPTDITQTAAGQTTTAVTWTEPTATDNVTPMDQITVVATHTPGQQFPVGTTAVSYIFRDLAGNEATCSFNVIVQSELFIIVVVVVCTPPIA